MTDLARIDVEIEELATTDDAHRCAEIVQRFELFESDFRDAKARFREALRDWIQDHGPLEIGTVRWYVGQKKKTKARDLHRVAELVLDVTAGDLDAFVAALSAGAFKPGHCAKLLGNRFEEVFEVTYEGELRQGKVRGALQRVDTAYLEGK